MRATPTSKLVWFTPAGALGVLAPLLLLAPASAWAQDDTCLSSTPSGSVIDARLGSEERVSIRTAFDARIDGARARLTIPSLGLEATASVRDVEFVMLETVEASPGVWLVAGTNVVVRSVGARTAVVEARSLHVTLGRLRVPRNTLALVGAPGTEGCAASGAPPPAWTTSEEERARGTARVIRRDTTVRDAGGAARVQVRGGAPVVRVEEREGHARVIVSDGGVRVLGWLASSELVAPTPRSGGAGVGDGRIGLGCLRGEAGVRSHVLPASAVLRRRPGGGPSVELPAGTTLLLGTTLRGHVAVIEALGVRRIPNDCDRVEPTGLGWIALDAL
ncbi:MAG: hypothetical protein R3B99_28990 [Polyangiales bacterium]